MIRYIRHENIDFDLWDACIRKAVNGTIYGWSFYLNAVTDNSWNALILDDYKAVMPLPVRKKYSISYVYQPRFAQQLGVFFNQKPDNALFYNFLTKIPLKYLKITQNLNALAKPEHCNLHQLDNFRMSLDSGYTEIIKGFNQNTKRNLKKYQKNNLQLAVSDDFGPALDLKKVNNVNDLQNSDFDRLENALQAVSRNLKLESYQVFNSENELIGAAIFTFSHGYAYYAVSASGDEGMKSFAMFGIVDAFIQKYAGTPLCLDFEGSMIPGIARFFSGWGAKSVPYFLYEKNRLPLIIRKFTK